MDRREFLLAIGAVAAGVVVVPERPAWADLEDPGDVIAAFVDCTMCYEVRSLSERLPVGYISGWPEFRLTVTNGRTERTVVARELEVWQSGLVRATLLDGTQETFVLKEG